MEAQKGKIVLLVDHGVASSFDNHIEINEKIYEDPELFFYILDHEKKHTNDLFSFKDYFNDFRINLKMISRLLKFMYKNPSTWYDLLPIYKRKGKLIYDFNMIISYSILILIIASLILFL